MKLFIALLFAGLLVAQNPVVRQGRVVLFTTQAATGTAISSAIPLPNNSGYGSLQIVGAGITGSPSGCQFTLAFQESIGGATGAVFATQAFTPAVSNQQFNIVPSNLAYATGDSLVAVFSCGAYPSAGTLSVTWAGGNPVSILGTVPMTGTFWQSTQPVSGAFYQTTQPVSAASLPLPSGASTSTLQSTGNASLATVATNLPAQGQALAAASLPVVLTAAQLTTLTPPAAITNYAQETGGNLATLAGAVASALIKTNLYQGGVLIGTANPLQVTGANGTFPVTGAFWQTTQPVSIASLPTGAVTGTFWQTTQPVSGTFYQITQPVSAASLPLPTGASTSALQSTGNTSLATVATNLPAQGQALAAASLPVVLTAAQIAAITPPSSYPVTGTFYQTTQPVSGAFWQATQPVSIASLPTGAVTGTFWQSTQPVSVASLPAQGQALAAASLPVVLPISQITSLTPPAAITGFALETGGNLATLAGTVASALMKTNLYQGGTLIGSGNPLQVTGANGTFPVTGTFWQGTQPVSGAFYQATQPVSAASLPLPTGASTSALQSTGNASLATLATNLPAQGQALAGASIPVVLTAAQIAAITPPSTYPMTGTFWQATQPVSIASLPTGAVTGTFWQTTQPVSGTFWQSTQPVSLASLPAQGQALAAASLPVVLPAAQITTLTPPAAITGFALETGGNLATLAGAVSASLMKTNLYQGGTLIGSGNPLQVTGANGTFPVTGTFWQTTQPVSIASLPTGAVTGTFWQTTQPVSIATAPALVGSSATIGKVDVLGNAGAIVDAAAGATAAANSLQAGGVYNASPPAPSTGQQEPVQIDGAGNLLVMPYGNPANFIRGSAYTGGTGSTGVFPPQGGSLRNYVASCQIANTSATNTTVQLFDGYTFVTQIMAPAVTGANLVFVPPLQGTANTAFNFTSGAAVTSMTVSCSGFKGL